MPSHAEQRLSVQAGFVQRFADAWADPSPRGFSDLFAPEIRLVAPTLPVTEGIRAAEAGFARLLAVFKGLHGVVHDWAPHPDGVFIEFTLAGKLGGHPVSWRGVDRFLLRDGLATERLHYFDTLPVMLLTRRAWRAWPGLVRAGARPHPPHIAPRSSGLGAAGPAAGFPMFLSAYERVITRPTSAGLASLLGDRGELRVPGLRPLTGGPSSDRRATLLALLPELHGDVVRAGARDQALYIETVYEARAAGWPLRWPQVDRIELEGTVARRWDAFLDTLPFALRWRRPRYRRAVRALH